MSKKDEFLQVRMSSGEKEALKELSTDGGVSELVRHLIREYLLRHEEFALAMRGRCTNRTLCPFFRGEGDTP